MRLICSVAAVANSQTLKRFLITSASLLFSVTCGVAQEAANASTVIEDVLTNFDVCSSLGITANVEQVEEIENLQKEKQLLEFALNESKNLAAEQRNKFNQCKTEKRSLQSELNAALENNDNDDRIQGYIQTTNALRLELRELNEELRNLKSSKQTTNQVNYSKVILDYKKRVQSLLNAKNCSAGKVDGIIGKKTIDAAQWFARSIKYNSFNGDIFDEQFFNELNSNPARCRSAALSTKRKLSESDRTALNGKWNLTATCDGGRLITASGVLKYARNDATTVSYEVADYKNNLGDTAIGTVTHSNIGTSAEMIMATLWFKGGITATAQMSRTSKNVLNGNDSNGCNLVARR